MANVITDNAQVKACEEINKMLEEVRLLNTAITEKKSFSFPVSRKQTITLDAFLTDKFTALLRQQRVKRVKEINARASKFRIALDDDERMAISDEILLPAEEGSVTEEPTQYE